VSAFCCTRGVAVVSSSGANTPAPSITARPSLEEKLRFAELAASRGVSESALALIAIRVLLHSNGAPSSAFGSATRREVATDRITIRLRPGDGRALQDRAARRGMKPSAYLAALVRAHVTGNPPLPTNELAIVKQGVVILAGLGRLLARTARRGAEEGHMPPELQQELSRTRAVVAALEQRTHELARAALVAWESRSD
jgi:hypothetical protein